MTWYNTTNFTRADSFIGMIDSANLYTQGLFGTLILIGFFIVLIIVLGKYEMKHRLTVASWTSAIIGMIYMPLGIINPSVVIFIVILFVFGFIGLFWD